MNGAGSAFGASSRFRRLSQGRQEMQILFDWACGRACSIGYDLLVRLSFKGEQC